MITIPIILYNTLLLYYTILPLYPQYIQIISDLWCFIFKHGFTQLHQVQKIMFQRHGVQSMSVCRKELLDMLHDRPLEQKPDLGDLGRHANDVVECFYIGQSYMDTLTL